MDWLKFIKSSGAKSKILSWFKKTQREENIVKGKELVEKEIKKIGINYSEIFKHDFVQVVLNKYKYNSVEDMYASVGFGAISAGKIVARLLEEYRKEHQEENTSLQKPELL